MQKRLAPPPVLDEQDRQASARLAGKGKHPVRGVKRARVALLPAGGGKDPYIREE